MPNAVRHSIPLLALLIPLVCGSGLAIAQSGSSGGSIGNDEKSLSGSRSGESAKPARRSQSEPDEPRRASRKSGGGGGNNFDGAWIVSSVGVTCQGTSSNAVVVTSGRIIGETARGTVSPDGRVFATTGKYWNKPLWKPNVRSELDSSRSCSRSPYQARRYRNPAAPAAAS